MSTSERKAKEKVELRAFILSAATRLFVEKGIEYTTMRNIADLVDYSVGTVYVYFKDKNAILHALHAQGFVELSSAFKVLFNVNNPLERLFAMGRSYIQFAIANPDMYDLMFNIKAPMEFLAASSSDEWNEGKATFDILKATVNECMKDGYFTGHESEALSFLIWSCVHGMCCLHIRQRIKGTNIHEPETIMLKAYDEFLKLINRK